MYIQTMHSQSEGYGSKTFCYFNCAIYVTLKVILLRDAQKTCLNAVTLYQLFKRLFINCSF